MNDKKDPKIKPSLLESTSFRVAIILGSILFIVTAIYIIDFEPNLSHLKVSMLSGTEKGNYYALAKKIAQRAVNKKGSVTVIATKGSLENIELLSVKKKRKRTHFAFVQNRMTKSGQKGMDLIAHLPITEKVFFLSKKANNIKTFAQLQGKRIGIGPVGSGTDMLARQIFNIRGFDKLHLQLANYSITDQLQLLKTGQLDIGVFVIAEDAEFISAAIIQHKLEIVEFKNINAIPRTLRFLGVGKIYAGQFDPIKNIPAKSKEVLKVDTLIIADSAASRSEVIGVLSIFAEMFPNFINYNKTKMNFSGLMLSKDAKDFYNNHGPDIMDQYAPWLVDITPVGNLVHIVMIISILFNIMGGVNKFRLWRIDAIRVKLESEIINFFEIDIVFADIGKTAPEPMHKTGEKRHHLDEIINNFKELKRRCRKQSVSMFVPMGQEMAYRYQENIIHERITNLYLFRDKLK